MLRTPGVYALVLPTLVPVHRPCKHAFMCQHQAGSKLMLTASAQYRSSAGTQRHVFKGIASTLVDIHIWVYVVIHVLYTNIYKHI